jgi:hypothetical protein
MPTGEDEADAKGVSPPAPSAKSLDEGYNQTYIIMKNGSNVEEKSAGDDNEVFFRCGNWCYKGVIQFNGLKIGTADLPILIPTLQRQQGSLRYYCNSNRYLQHSFIVYSFNFVLTTAPIVLYLSFFSVSQRTQIFMRLFNILPMHSSLLRQKWSQPQSKGN